ncbi:hypothetical protein HYX07_03305 [Candidatus Woesearchaeota archaeon]|nr:hypothetical protein [Candidatus Woesearchaeota archaeon]
MASKKEVIVLFVFIFGALISINALADEVGCCSNPGAGQLACSTDRLALRDKECCPKPEVNFQGYYKSQQNPDGPVNSNDCSTLFFFPNKACLNVEACSLGCCCSELGGTIAPEAQCKATGLIFHKGETNCNQVCPIPQCNDGLDNDNNGCSDFEGGDLGCTSPADKEETGGSCVKEGVGCSNPSYVPKLSNLEIIPLKGQRKFLLKWKDECSETAVSYDILRCKDSGCTNFVLVGITNTNSFEDASGDLLADTTYTYQVKARYNLQTANPTITKAASLGSIECIDKFDSSNFCVHQSYYIKYKNYLNTNFPELFLKNFNDGIKTKFGDKFNKAFFCDSTNKLISEGTSCSSSQICVVNSNKPSCLSKVSCNYNAANPFGLFYTQQDCETDRYCFYDRSHSTVDSCFGCDPSMSCYDYKTEDACTRDNCKISNCKWKKLADQIGIGVCTSSIEYNCQWCDKKGTQSLENTRAFNEVFDFCTRDKSNALSESDFKCYFRNGKSKNCDDVVCKDYDAEQCSNAQIAHDETNRIKNPSLDECGIKVCQNINNACAKNADGDNKADCTTNSCEADYFAPNATLLPIIKKGVVDSLVIQIHDRTSINSSIILKTSPDYLTFMCVEPCGANGHPYNSSLSSRTVIITNLNAFDGSNGNKLLSLSDGSNVIRYYSQDPAKNIEEIKKIIIEAHDKTDGPRIFSLNVTDGTKVLDKIYTSNQKPTIEVQFFEPAAITHSRLVNKNTGLIVPLQAGTDLNAKFSFQITEALPIGEYTFELNAKNKNNIFMDPSLSQVIVIDNSKPTLGIMPQNGEIFNTSAVAIKLVFDKEVNLETVNINSEDIKNSLSTINNKEFTAIINLSDGNKNLEVSARDFAKNQVIGSVSFIVDANPAVISLISPRFGVAQNPVFDIIVETDNDAACRYSLDNNFEFDFMDPFTETGGTKHTISGFSKIPSNDFSIHKLNVRCKDQRGVSFRSFSINIDTTPPILKSAFAFPNPIIEKPSTTSLTVESDEPVLCKFSNISREFDSMENKFEGFDGNNFKTISKQGITVESEASFLFFVACKNKAELVSDTKEISFKVDLTVPISIISHTPEFFNSTNAVLAIETNKKSQCKFSELDITAQNGEIFGAPGYSHTRQLTLSPGKHKFYVVCKDQFLQKFSDVASVSFTIDVSPPIILSVNDSSALQNNPEFTFSTDHLRVKWNSIDNESRVSSHQYSILEYGTLRVILNTTQSTLNNELLIATKPNSTSLELINGNKYFFRVRAQNIVGLLSNISESDGVTVDTSLKPLNCTNGVKDEKEADIDCGLGCDLCSVGKKCISNTDCTTNFCNNGICSAPKCDDNVRNQEESDTDCGGACKKCQNNRACSSNNDCESGFCSFGFCKPQESCLDGKLSPGESDADCGGHCPTKCFEGKTCSQNEDCGEGLQCISSVCKICAENDRNCNGIPDEQESAKIKDTDNDGMPDEWEIQNDLDPNNPNDAGIDADSDGLTSLEEYNTINAYGKSTNPNSEDTDADGFSDKEEIDKGTSPVDPEDFPKSSLAKTLSFIIGIAIILSVLGYLAYRGMEKRKAQTQVAKAETARMPVRQESKQMPSPIPKQKEQEVIKGLLKKKEEQKQKARTKLFEPFAGEKITKQETKVESKREQKQPKPQKPSKQEVFSKLTEIASGRAKESQKPKQKPKDRLEKLYELAKSKKKISKTKGF